MKDSISLSYDYLLDLYDTYPNLEKELRIVERKISKSYKVINKISESDRDYSNFFMRKKILRTLRKIKISMTDTIDHLSCISHPRAFYNSKLNDGYSGNWDSHKKHFMKKKFFERPDYIDQYDFNYLLDSLGLVVENIKELKITLRNINIKPTIKDFENSEFCLEDEFYETLIESIPGMQINEEIFEESLDFSDWPYLIENYMHGIDDDHNELEESLELSDWPYLDGDYQEDNISDENDHNDNQYNEVPDWITNYKNPFKKKNWYFYSEVEYGFNNWWDTSR